MTVPISLERLFKEQLSTLTAAAGVSIYQASRRQGEVVQGVEYILDQFDGTGTQCLFIRSRNTRTIFHLNGQFHLTDCAGGGWLLTPEAEGKSCYWIPIQPVSRQVNGNGQILNESNSGVGSIALSAESLSVTFISQPEFALDLVIFELPENATSIYNELRASPVSQYQSVFLWGSHTNYTKPADLFLHLIHGVIYEKRTSWPYYRKIPSENDAHALYVTLAGLQQTTGGKIYELLRSQIVLSIISRQGEDGAWRHGEWSDDLESHFRLHCSGMHLLMDALSTGNDAAVENSLRIAASFIAKQYDSTMIGTWYLHDELELTEETMRKSPFKWAKSNAFGKRLSNMLVLNTHLDTTIALDRYALITGDQRYCIKVSSAREATSALLKARPAESLYRLIFRIIELTWLPTEQARKLPTHFRILKRLGWKYLIPNLHHLKKTFPRINMPGGYIDRALTLKGVAPAYQSINTMDLARYIRRFPDDLSLEQMEQTLEFSHRKSFRSYLGESEKTRYALGFWAETLYHLCTIDDAAKYRQWLADTIIDLGNNGMGLPPSILGGNMEALSSPLPTATTYNAGPAITVANLSHDLKTEFLLVNAGSASETFENGEYLLIMSGKDISTSQDIKAQEITMAPGSWISIQPAKS